MRQFFERLPPESPELRQRFASQAKTGVLEESQAKKVWTELAPHWLRIQGHGLFAITGKVLFSNVHFLPTDRIVSLGAGPGLFETFLAKEIVPQGKVALIDLAHDMGKQALELSRREGVSNLSVITGSMERLPLAANSADVVLALNSLQWVKHWQNAIGAAKRVLKKEENARLVVLINEPSKTGTHRAAEWGTHELLRELERQRFEMMHGVSFVVQGRDGDVQKALIVAKPPLYGVKDAKKAKAKK